MTTTSYTGKPVYLPSSTEKRVVVIGGGFAGISLVSSLRGVPVQVVMLDRNNFHMFQPLLYQVATCGIEPDNISFPLRKMFRGNPRFVYRMAEVLRIIPEKNTVITDIGYLTYDFLVIATGSKNNFYGNRQLEQYATGLKTVQESLDIRSLMLQNLEEATNTFAAEERSALMTFVVAGGGPAGVEMAGALAEFRNHIFKKDYPEMDPELFRVYLIEGGERLLPNMDRTLSQFAIAYLSKMNIKVMLNTMVHAYNGHIIELSDKKYISSRTLIWTAGVTGQLPEGIKSSALTHGNRLLTNTINQVDEYDNLFAIGDIALIRDKEYPEGHPMVAQVALQQGHHLALNISNILKGKQPIPFLYHDKGMMATIGRKRAVAQTGRKRWKGMIAWWLWSLIHLVSISGFRNKILVGFNWFWNYLTYDRGNRLIIRKYKQPEIHKILLS